MIAGFRAIRAAILVVLISSSVLGQRSGDPQPRSSPRGIRPDVNLPAEAAGWEHVVDGLLSAFDKADVIALGASRGTRGSELRIRLIRHPDFPTKARFIVVEWGNALYQSNLDRYIKGEDVPLEELQQVWRNQTQIASWDSPIYAEFFAAVREINQKLPPARQLRVLGGDPPIDWSKIQTITDYMSFAGGEHRDESLASVLRNQVIKNHEKALVIYGSAHFKAVEESATGRVFVVSAQGGSGPGYEEFEKALQSRERPVLLSLRWTPAAAFAANQFSWGARRFAGGKEVPLFAPDVTLGDLADACVYFGQGADADPDPDPAIYRGTPYGAEIARRRQILDSRH
jgi:hypothetical protein